MMKVKREKGESSRQHDDEGTEVVDAGEETQPGLELARPDGRRLRSQYRELSTQVNESQSQLAQVDFGEFKSIVEKADKLHKHVKKPREQITDAEFFVDVTNGLLVVAKGARVKGGMSAAEFVGAILHIYGLPGSVDKDSSQNVDWEAMGLDASAILRHAPGVSTMVGPMEVELKPRKAPASRRREKPTEKTRPQVVEEVDADRPSTETDANMQTMFKILADHQEVEVGSLILNRSSFAQTIENLFALSFLVKDGRVEMKFAEDGSQLVVPRNAPAHADRAAGEVLNTQFVFRLDYRCWQLMQDSVTEGSEVMPHRLSVAAPGAIPRNGRTPIRKNSRNRARETPAVADEAEDISGEGSSRRLKRRLQIE